MPYFILMSTSPGEVGAWVPNIARALRHRFGESVVIDLFLTPCQFSSGNEKAVAISYSDINRVFSPKETLQYFTQRQKVEGSGLIIGLGSDLIYLSMMQKKTGFSVAVYSEHNHLKFPKSYRIFYKNSIGDLMQDSILRVRADLLENRKINGIIFNAGSRPQQFLRLVPYWIETIKNIQEMMPNISVAISVSPFIQLENYDHINQILLESGIEVIRSNYLTRLASAKMLVTIPGTNTAEAMYLGVPMIVVLPTFYSSVFQFPGLLGLLSEIPLLGRFIKFLVVQVLTPFAHRMRFALPNIILNQTIVPELIGKVSPQELAQFIYNSWNSESFFESQKRAFEPIRPIESVAEKMVSEISKTITLA